MQIREQRTILNFVLLVIVGIATTLFILKKANEAVAEINVYANQPLLLATSHANGGITSGDTAIDTSTWKTYRNEKYGFEFKYPQDWQYIEDSVAAGNWIEAVYITPKEKYPAVEVWEDGCLTHREDVRCAGLTIEILKSKEERRSSSANPKMLPPLGWLSGYYGAELFRNKKLLSVDGLPALRASPIEGVLMAPLTWIFEDVIVFQIEYTSHDVSKQIFSTFKVLK